MPKIPERPQYPTQILRNAEIILAAIPFVQPEGECKDCDLDVGFMCPICGLCAGASDLARYILYGDNNA